MEKVICTSTYSSPIGNLLLAADENHLIGLWIENQKYYLAGLNQYKKIQCESVILTKTKKWLDKYFKSEKPDINELEFKPIGSEFQVSVWNILKQIPYGQVLTYKEIALKIAEKKGIEKMSAQAVGNAVGHNPISIIIPCHRVIGTNGSLTGYAGGIEKKAWLLKHEKAQINFLSKEMINE